MIEVEKGSPNELSNIAAKETIYLPTEKTQRLKRMKSLQASQSNRLQSHF